MGRRSGGNATVLASEPGRAVPVDGDRRVVEIRVGPSHQTQDGCRTLESLREYRGRRPSSSNVKEFYNTTLERWLKKESIRHFSTLGDAKASIVERFNRTLKSRLYRYFTAANTTQYLDILPSLVQRYNEDVNRSIGMAPKNVTVKNEAEVWQRLYGQVTKTRRRGRLKAGDKVRLSERVKTFKKAYLPQWTEEVFRIQRVIQGPVLMYKVEEFDGTPVKGTFYAEDLQKVTVDDDMLWRVEKVLKRRRGQMLVRWKGWPSKYDSWIKAA